MQIKPRRSVLYMPGIKERALEKAKSLPADSLILDLEDSVSPESKKDARKSALKAIAGGGYGKRELVLRVNALETPWGARDLSEAATSGADAVLLPKVSRPGDILSSTKVLRAAGAPLDMQVWAMIETPASIMNIREIAAVGGNRDTNLTCLVLGTNDLLKESRALAHDNRIAVVPWLAMTIAAARAFDLDVIDGVYNNFRDDEGLRSECQQGRTLGMDGKTLIHPSQVEPCNEIFSPSSSEVDWARQIIAAFAEPRNQGMGVITIDGRMVERLHEVMAQRTVAIADAISASA